MAPTASKNKPPVRDFAKRPRAKVGKRAPAKVNATDTSFKTATVAVRSQCQSLDKSKQQQGKDAIQSSARMELFSSRGNTLATLQMSLRHHAAAVRASGLRGIRDSIQSLSSLEAAIGVAILEANLPSLLPHLCRCWLDEDNDVRSLALNLFGDILKCLSSSQESVDLKCLVPFVPFLCAYASSALNSLDRSIRIDGASIVAMLASAVQSPTFSQLMSSSSSKMSAMSKELSNHVDSLLPSMERLLASISLGRRASNNSEKKSESQKSTTTSGQKRGRSGKPAPSAQTKASSKRESRESSTAQSIHLSLAFLLRVSQVSNEDMNEINYTKITNFKRKLLPSLNVSGDCSFVQGGSVQSNSLLLIRGLAHGSRSVNESRITSIRDLPAMNDEVMANSAKALVEDISAEEYSSRPVGNDTNSMEKLKQMTSLLETLHGKVVEVAHLGKRKESGGLMSSSKDLETMDILVQMLRLSHARFQDYYRTISKHCIPIENDSSAPQKKREKSGKKLTKTLQNVHECLVAYQTCVDRALQLLLENFPITSFGETTNPERYEFSNACICSAIVELGGWTLFDDGKKASPWVDTVSAFILPRLTFHHDSFGQTNEGDPYSESKFTNMLLKAVMKLLLPTGSNSSDDTESYLLKDNVKRQEILKAFAKAFFPRLCCSLAPQHYIYESSSTTEVQDKIKEVANSAAGQTACVLVAKLVARSADRFLKDPADSEYTILLLQMLSVLPTYLEVWKGKCPEDTGLALASILSVVRQWKGSGKIAGELEPVSSALEELCIGLRHSIETLFNPIDDSQPMKQIRKKRKKVNIKHTCIFERLPEQVQKLAIGIVGLLQCPTEMTAKHLSRICSKAFISHTATSIGNEEYVAVSLDMANYVREVMYILRKTMPMPYYLSFLLDGSGIEQTTYISLVQNRSPEDIFLYDSSVDQLCRFLTTCCDKASLKVLPMLRPIIEKWLLAPTKINESEVVSNETMRLLVQGRAAISILSAFTWDNMTSNLSDDVVIIPESVLDDKLVQLILNAIFSLFEASGIFWSRGSYFDDAESKQLYLAKLLGPVTVLLRYRKGMLQQFIETVSKRVVSEGSGEQNDLSTSNSSAVVEINMNALLMILKSKDPVLMTNMIQRNYALQKVLLAAAQTIETTVSGGSLAHLGSKLHHYAKHISK